MIPAMEGDAVARPRGKGFPRTGRPSPSPFFFAAALLLAVAAAPVGAFSFSPIAQDFAPAGPGSVQSFRLENEGAEPVAVRISMLSRQVDPQGRESNSPADSLFVVYPSRAVLAPNSAQAVRVQWKGPADIDAEQCFRILVEQLPVDFGGQEKQKGSIRVLFRYLGAVYIVPKTAAPDVVLEASEPALDPAGRRGLALVFANRGTAHVILGELTVTVTAGQSADSPRLVVDPQDLAGLAGENLLPRSSRRHFLALPEGFAPGASKDDLRVSFTFEPIR
jgi:fimbrial chaperone protein